MTLRQIAGATKISISALEALERNDVARLPGGIFSRAFVRAYAAEVGLDPEETVRDFIAQFPHESVTAGHPTSTPIEDNQQLESDRLIASTALRLGLISLPLAMLVVYFGTAGTRQPQSPQPLSQPAMEATAGRATAPAAEAPARAEPPPTAPAAGPAPSASQPRAERPARADRLVIGLSATAPCWVSAVADGQQVIRRELEPGEEQRFEVQREIVMSIGDAGAVAVTLNGAPARPLGRRGQVLESVRISVTNFPDYLAVP